MAPSRVGGSGKPVRNRRGPATVTGDAGRVRLRAAATGPPRRPGKARFGRPGSQETSLRPPSRKPSWKGVAHHMHKLFGGLAAGLALLVAAPGAIAAPVTVDLRIEGPTRTLFEGPVTTDVRTFRFTGDATAHRCDGTAANHGTGPAPAPTRGAVVAEAAERAPFTI